MQGFRSPRDPRHCICIDALTSNRDVHSFRGVLRDEPRQRHYDAEEQLELAPKSPEQHQLGSPSGKISYKYCLLPAGIVQSTSNLSNDNNPGLVESTICVCVRGKGGFVHVCHDRARVHARIRFCIKLYSVSACGDRRNFSDDTGAKSPPTAKRISQRTSKRGTTRANGSTAQHGGPLGPTKRYGAGRAMQ